MPLTVDREVVGDSHGADRVADPTLVGAVVGAVNGLNEHGSVVDGETDSAGGTERTAILHPHSGADGARGLASKVREVFVFYQGGWWTSDVGAAYWL